MDILLAVDAVLDCCDQGRPGAIHTVAAVERCSSLGYRVWLYVGANFETQQALAASFGQDAARAKLAAFSADKQWLAALAGEGDVFTEASNRNEQHLRALNRFSPGSIALITRDIPTCELNDARVMTAEQYSAAALPPAPIEFIDLKIQQCTIRDQLELGLHRVMHHGQYILGTEVKELEVKLAEYTGSKHCITCASGTEALLMSLMALGIGPGDEVITTPFTFAATAEMIVLIGATPVFVDIESDTCLIDANLIEAKITSRTKAIMPVSLYGQVADMDAINKIAKKHGNIAVIEDAAQSFGASYWGFKNSDGYIDGVTYKSCNLSTIGCTSFFPSKPLGCYGDGGAIFTNDDSLAQALREIRVHGQSKRYYHTRIGVGGRMDTLQCAIVLAKLNILDKEIADRKLTVAEYEKAFANLPTINLLTIKHDRDCVWAQYVLLSQHRSDILEWLKRKNIPTAIHYPRSISSQPIYQQYCCEDCVQISVNTSNEVFSIPMPILGEGSSADYITTSLKQFTI
jgi:UDP-2-acetamido-2-deoxy-ribo-hexuluronate aminotransferase